MASFAIRLVQYRYGKEIHSSTTYYVQYGTVTVYRSIRQIFASTHHTHTHHTSGMYALKYWFGGLMVDRDRIGRILRSIFNPNHRRKGKEKKKKGGRARRRERVTTQSVSHWIRSRGRKRLTHSEQILCSRWDRCAALCYRLRNIQYRRDIQVVNASDIFVSAWYRSVRNLNFVVSTNRKLQQQHGSNHVRGLDEIHWRTCVPAHDYCLSPGFPGRWRRIGGQCQPPCKVLQMWENNELSLNNCTHERE